jgi:glycosyltransferase involved in cell wall biosynthesis
VSRTLPSVAFDVTALAGTRTGIGRAVAECLAALEALPDGIRVVPYAFGASLPRLRGDLPKGTRTLPVSTRALLWAWSRMERPKLDRMVRPARLLHATAFVAPPTRLPQLVTVHDCAFARFPQLVAPSVRAFGRILRRAVARGAWLHCTTETIAQEVDELFGPGLRAAGRIAIVPFAAPTLGNPSPLPSIVGARVRGRPYVLAVGALEPRKNFPRLVRAFGAIGARHPDLALVIAGPDGPDGQAVREAASSLEPAARERVIVTGFVPDGGLRTLMDGAAVLCYPSLYEGFGFPMLEAMSLGVPVVAAEAGALPEVAHGAANLVDPRDSASIAAGIEAVIGDQAWRRGLVERGRTRAAELTWSATARKLCAVYEDLAASAARISS